MFVTLENLRNLADRALKHPPQILMDICGDYYAPYYNLIYLLAHTMRPCTIVELGVEQGRWVSCALLASSENTVIGVDSVDRDSMYDMMEQYPNFTFIHSASMYEMSPPDGIPDGIDILHIDTEHSYGMVCSEFYTYKPYLSDNAIVLFDDLRAADDDVLRCFDELDYPKFREDELHDANGYGVMIYVRKGY